MAGQELTKDTSLPTAGRHLVWLCWIATHIKIYTTGPRRLVRRDPIKYCQVTYASLVDPSAFLQGYHDREILRLRPQANEHSSSSTYLRPERDLSEGFVALETVVEGEPCAVGRDA